MSITNRSIAQFIENWRAAAPTFEKLRQQKFLTVMRDPNNGQIGFNINMVSPELASIAALMIHHSQSGKLSSTQAADCYISCEFICGGPKVFRPRAEELEALEEIEVRIPIEHYCQPFPTLCIEFPESYRRSHMAYGEGCRSGKHTYQPLGVIVTHIKDLNAILMAIVTDSPDGMNITALIGSKSAETLEDDIKHKASGSESVCDDEEFAITQRCMRAAINTCLMLMEKGFRKYPDTAHKKKLQKYVENARRGKGDLETATRNLRLVPDIFEFEQHVSIRTAVGCREAAEPCPTGRKVKPHWRSSHWRMQRYGAGLASQKRILIPHCMVNKDKFHGSDSKTTMTAE